MPDERPFSNSKIIEDAEVLQDIYLKSLEASPDAIIVVNDKGEIVVFNVQAEFLFGYARSEVVGQQVEMLIPDALRERHTKHVEHYIEEPHVRDMGIGLVLNGKHRSGKALPVQIKLSPMMIAERGTHVMAVIRKTPPISASTVVEVISPEVYNGEKGKEP